MRQTRFLIACGAIAFWFAAAAGDVSAAAVVLNDARDEYVIGTGVEYLEDASGALTIEDAASRERAGSFKRSESDTLNFGYTSSAWWLRFTLTNNSKETEKWILEYGYPLVDDIQIYSKDRDGWELVKKGGRIYPFSQREEKYRLFAFSLEVPPGTARTYYLRVKSADSLPAPLTVYSQKGFREHASRWQFILGIYYGIIIILLVFIAVIIITAREPAYLWYMAYLIMYQLMFQMTLNGITPHLIESAARPLFWSRDCIALFYLIGVLPGLMFSKKFLETKKYFPLLDRAIVALLAVHGAMLAAFFFVDYYYLIQVIIYTSMVLSPALTMGAVVIYFRGHTPARFYVIAWGFFLSIAFFYCLKTLGFMPSTWFTEHALQIGLAWNATFISIAIADMINYLRVEKNRAQQEALALKDDLNRSLEKQVKERTAELESALRAMEDMNGELTATRDALWGEMELAKKIQTVLLPKGPSISGYEISVFMAPASEVGGDYYDIINAGGIDWIVIGDVSGHGVGAGLVMMMAQTSIHTVLAKSPDLEPHALLEIVNRVIARNIQRFSEDKYMTITVMAAHRNGAFFFSGLHQDILVFRKERNGVERIATDGMWLGLFENIQGMLDIQTLDLAVGDTILLFTDGITEAWRKESVADARSPETEMFGQSRLEDILSRTGNAPPDDIKAAILDELDGYECRDDITMVLLKRVE